MGLSVCPVFIVVMLAASFIVTYLLLKLKSYTLKHCNKDKALFLQKAVHVDSNQGSTECVKSGHLDDGHNPLFFTAAHGENRGGRFQNVTELRLAGLEVTDAVSRLLVRYLPHLTKLDLSQCCHITDQTIHTLTSPLSPLRESLTHVSLAGTHSHLPASLISPISHYHVDRKISVA